MCLALYLGTNIALEIPTETPLGGLGIEVASWTPPPLSRNHKYLYYLGRKREGAQLECACLLVEHVAWEETGAVVSLDPLYPGSGPCPFETLRSFCSAATADGRFATLVCDDSGGIKQECTSGDYGDAVYIPLEEIARGHLLFSDMPWRAITVVNERPTET